LARYFETLFFDGIGHNSLPCHWYCASGSYRAERPTNALTVFAIPPC